MKVAVLGSGGWGTALALLLLENGHDVTLWSYMEAESAALREKRENPVLPGVALPEELKLTSDIRCVEGCAAVVLATPSFAVRTTARQARSHMDPGTVVVSVSKGVEKETSLTLTDVIAQEVGERCPVAALSGPSHAEEVGRKVPTAVVAASRDKAAAQLVQDLFMSPRFRVYTTDDVVGVELGAALKHVIALCAGVSDGLGLGDNTKAMLMTRGLSEIARLGEALGGRKETFAGLAGVGDLIVTCTSMHSRNRRCGILIGEGKPVPEAMAAVGATVEGYFAAFSAHQLAEKMGVEMPICQSAYRVLYEAQPVESVVGNLMNRNKRREVDESWI